MEKKTPLGIILNDLRLKQKKSVIGLSKSLGVDRQTIYDTFKKKNSLKVDEIKRWAIALNVDFQFLMEAISGVDVNVSDLQTNDLQRTDSIDVLIDTMRQELREKSNEIREKNEQIRALQKALEQAQQIQTVLLGKSHEYQDKNVIWVNWGYRHVTTSIRA